MPEGGSALGLRAQDETSALGSTGSGADRAPRAGTICCCGKPLLSHLDSAGSQSLSPTLLSPAAAPAALLPADPMLLAVASRLCLSALLRNKALGVKRLHTTPRSAGHLHDPVHWLGSPEE